MVEEEPEEIMDEEAEDEGDVEEEEKNDGQEALDLELAEDEGSGSQDEQEANQDANVSNVDPEKLYEDDANNDIVEDALLQKPMERRMIRTKKSVMMRNC